MRSRGHKLAGMRQVTDSSQRGPVQDLLAACAVGKSPSAQLSGVSLTLLCLPTGIFRGDPELEALGRKLGNIDFHGGIS